MAEMLYADGAEPGVRRGSAARDLESATIYPVVLRHLHDCFAAFDRDSLLEELLAERVGCARRHSHELWRNRETCFSRARQNPSSRRVASADARPATPDRRFGRRGSIAR